MRAKISILIVSAFILTAIGLNLYWQSLPDEEDLKYIALCDTLAGDPDDPNKITGGIDPEDIDIDKAYDACTRAYQSGGTNERVIYQLGRLYSIKKNYQKAHGLFRDAANSRYAAAQYQVGRIIIDGFVVGNYRDATDMYISAAEQGHIPAMFQFAAAIVLLPDHTTADKAAALHWAKKAAGAGSSDGQFILGGAYHEGWFGEENQELALYWTTKSPDQDNVFALHAVASSWAAGIFGDKNIEKAIYYSKKLMEISNKKHVPKPLIGTVAFILGRSYLTGEGVIQDIETAKKWLNISANAGYGLAIEELNNIE